MQAREYIKKESKEDEALRIVLRAVTRRVMQHVKIELENIQTNCNSGLLLHDIVEDGIYAEYQRQKDIREHASIVMDALKRFMDRSK